MKIGAKGNADSKIIKVDDDFDELEHEHEHENGDYI